MTYQTLKDHQSMIFDNVRNDLYYKALQKHITAHSVVLDLGAGLGIFGLFAAKLGAKRVYLVEPEEVIHLAKQTAKINGLAERITCIQGHIEDIQLPEKVDIIISVFTGNFLLEENLLPSLFFARDTYLKPNGLLIPNAATMHAVPVSQPSFYEQNITIWSKPQQGINFSKIKKKAANSVYYHRKAMQKAIYLATPQILMAMDFYQQTHANCNAMATYNINLEEDCHGFVGWFQMQIGDHTLCTAPNATETHWTPAFLPLDPIIHCKKKETLLFKLNRKTRGHWSWQVRTKTSTQYHSTFIAQILSTKALQKASNQWQPQPSDLTQQVIEILQTFDGQTSIQDIAKQWEKRYNHGKYTLEMIEILIAELANKY